jgi:antitoxin component YwqK of YwqJK toxin-antitoxin module
MRHHLATQITVLSLLFLGLSSPNSSNAQSEGFYRYDTTKVIVSIQKIEGVRDTMYALKPRTLRTGSATIYYDKALQYKAMECEYRRFTHQGTDVYFYSNGAKQKKATVQEGVCVDSLAIATGDSVLTAHQVREYWCKQYCGNFNWWYADGQIRAQGIYIPLDEKRCGVSGQWYFWYPNGQVKRVISYNETGLKHGVYKEYYNSGEPKYTGEYFADQKQQTSYRHGTWKVYDLEGELMKEVRYLLGLRVSK